MSYRTTLIAHLSAYRKQLGIEEQGLFRYRGTDVLREHILPIERKWDNLLPATRDTIRNYVDTHGIKLHRYFHHLTSSQAFAFNLFIPFFERGLNSSRALIRAFGQAGDLAQWKPEAVPDKKEETNLDAWWKLDTGLETFCEVKLCESEFGNCKADARHKAKLRSTYEPVLRRYISPALLEEEHFFANYQVLRNIWHLAKSTNGELIFLMPEANHKLSTDLKSILADVSEPLRNRVRVVGIESLLDSLSSDASCPRPHIALARQLQAKYIPR